MELTLSIMSKDFWVGTIFGVVILGAVSTYLVRGLDHLGPRIMGLLAKHAKGVSAWAKQKKADLKSPENAGYLIRLRFRIIRMKIECLIFMVMGCFMVGILLIGGEALSSAGRGVTLALGWIAGAFFFAMALSYWIKAEWYDLLIDLSEDDEKLKSSKPTHDPEQD